MKAKSKIKINKGKLVSKLVGLCALLFITSVFVGLVKSPEQYLTTWKYQSENELTQGNQNEYLNMATVIGYEVSDGGVMLLTNDGNGYFIEK